MVKDMVTDFEIIPYRDKIEHIADLDFDFYFIDTPRLCQISYHN
jgi:chromosome partitioning protein